MSWKVTRQSWRIATLATIFMIVLSAPLLANPLGIGAGEAGLPQTGLFSSLFAWINAAQQEFYRSLTSALRSMRDGEGGVWMLVGLSFAYGVFHAAGPGHGKAVISSYMLANEVALRRGVVLSFLSSLMQGAVAIVLIGLVFLFLRGTSISMREASHFLEMASYLLVAAFGAWLLWRKAVSLLPQSRSAVLDAGNIAPHPRGEAYSNCTACGHSHAPDPALLKQERLDLRSAWTAVTAVGIRPCSGALIVLTFAFLNGLWAGGVLSVFAMSLGTAITVSILATLAVSGKNLAGRLAGKRAALIHHAIEIAGALMVMVLGLLLLAASI